MKPDQVIQLVSKIPLFADLAPREMKMLFKICRSRLYQPEGILCTAASESTELFILLSGKLEVLTAEGRNIATVVPVTTIGEMGVITGETRSATVQAIWPSNVFVIAKTSFDRLMKDRNIIRKIYKNIIDSLSEKVKDANATISALRAEQAQTEVKIAETEQTVARLRQLLKARHRKTIETADPSKAEAELRKLQVLTAMRARDPLRRARG